MNNNENLVNYYDNSVTYVRFITKELKKMNEDIREEYIKIVYNYLLNQYPKEEIDFYLKEVLYVTALLESRVSSIHDLSMKKRFLKELYLHYLFPILACYSNGDLFATNTLFDYMVEQMKKETGYYGFCRNIPVEYQNNYVKENIKK